MTILVDSDILIEVSRARDEQVASRWISLGHSGNVVLYSPVTAAEVWGGALPHEHQILTNLFRTLLCAAIDQPIGRQAGDYLRQYRKSHGLALGDALIAATAVQNKAALWTRNLKHYPMKDLTFY